MFYLGTHEVSWLRRLEFPLFISARRLRRQQSWPRAIGRWSLDSGGFSEISLHGEWITTPMQYAIEVRRWQAEIGRLDWAAIQDWMCEPQMLSKTGRTVFQHQKLTIQNYADLKSMAPDLPWKPVLQGWQRGDYLKHLEMYRRAGFDDTSFGLGSVCRRQETGGIHGLIAELKSAGIAIHAFGFKTRGLKACGHLLESSDSMAWSVNARYHPPIPGHTHKTCSNCIVWATRWRERMLMEVAT